MYFQGLNSCCNWIEEMNYITQHVLTTVFCLDNLKAELASLTFRLKNTNANVTYFSSPFLRLQFGKSYCYQLLDSGSQAGVQQVI